MAALLHISKAVPLDKLCRPAFAFGIEIKKNKGNIYSCAKAL